MRGVDTNVLVRLVTGDDPEQSRAARELVEGAEARGERLHIATIVLCELVWELRGKAYGHSRDDVDEVLGRLLETEVFVVEDRDLVLRRWRRTARAMGISQTTSSASRTAGQAARTRSPSTATSRTRPGSPCFPEASVGWAAAQHSELAGSTRWWWTGWNRRGAAR